MKTIRCEQERPSIWVSLFKNFTDSHPIGEVDVLHWLLEPSSEMLNALDFIRKTDDKEVRNFIKARLPAITPSGLFSVRKKRGADCSFWSDLPGYRCQRESSNRGLECLKTKFTCFRTYSVCRIVSKWTRSVLPGADC